MVDEIEMTNEVEQIITFITDSDNGRRWVDLVREFKKRGWSHGKFVNHWKKTEPFREQRPTEMGKRYFIKDSYNKEATKFVLAKDLKEQELNKINTINISNEEMEKALIKLAEAYRNQSINRSTFLKANKLWNSYKHLFSNFCEENLRQDSKYWNVFIQHPSGVSTPDLSLDDKFAILKVLSRLAATRTPIKDVEKRTFTVILSYNPSLEEESEEEQREILKRKIAAWQKDKGIKKITKEHLKIMDEDELKMRKLFLEATQKWFESLD